MVIHGYTWQYMVIHDDTWDQTTEMKNNLVVNLDDTYKLDHMEDKLTKLENTLKLETGLPKSGVIDLDTDKDALKHETSKLMNEMYEATN